MFAQRIKASFLALPILATALVASAAVAAGGGIASAATIRPASGTAPVWHDLKLLNGWASSQSDWSTGDPAWTARGGIVYLSGSAHLTTGSNTEVAVLPPSARPAVTQYLTVYTEADTSGVIDIYPNGTVYAHSADSVSAGQFTSFAGLSFPAAATTRHKLRLENGWKPGLAAWQSGPPTYTVSDGMVHLSGALRLPAKGSAVFAVLPKSARPASKLYVSVLTADFSVGAISIDTDGRMEMQSASGTQFTSLAGIAFTTATTGRATLHLIDGWQSGQAKYHTGAPAYSVTDGVVHLSGSLTQPAGGNSELAVLPAAIRPTHDLYIQVYTVSGDLGTVRIEPDGAVLASSHTGTTASVFTSLAGICYPLKS